MMVRLTKKLAEVINDVDLRAAHVGDILIVARRDGQVLVAEGWAVPYVADHPRAEAADASGTAPAEPAEACLAPIAGGPAAAGPDLTATRRREWELFGLYPVNALLVGPSLITQQCLDMFRQQFRPPVVTVNPGAPLSLPTAGEVGTIILHDVGALGPLDQQRLLEWIDMVYSRTRVITTSPTPIVPTMAEGGFLQALYYRLNILYITVSRDAHV
jgi:hypothetical protein